MKNSSCAHLFSHYFGKMIPKIDMFTSKTINDLKMKIKKVITVIMCRQTLKFDNVILINDKFIS